MIDIALHFLQQLKIDWIECLVASLNSSMIYKWQGHEETGNFHMLHYGALWT